MATDEERAEARLAIARACITLGWELVTPEIEGVDNPIGMAPYCLIGEPDWIDKIAPLLGEVDSIH